MIHISQFYPCSEVTLACELYYICELGKYSKIKHDTPVSLDGVILSKVLKKSPIWEHFRIAVHEGWLVNTGISDNTFAVTPSYPVMIDNSELRNYLICTDEVVYDATDSAKRREDYNYRVMAPQPVQVSFQERNDEYWLWSIGGEGASKFMVNNNAINHNRADQSWVSLIAMVAVERLFTGAPKKLLLHFSSQVVVRAINVSYVLILSEETSCMTGWCEFYFDEATISDKVKLHLGYVSWYVKGRDIGMCDRWYNGKEKYAYATCKFGLQEGDLCMFYLRDKSAKQDYIKSIVSCHLAKIIKMTPKEIELELINTTKPYYQGKVDFDNHTMAVKRMYMDVMPYEKINTSMCKYSMADIGVEYMLYTETCFIAPLEETNDLRVITANNGVRTSKFQLPQNELVWWILKDYGYEFNEQRFLDRYFRGSEPVREVFMRDEPVEDYFYYREDG